MRPLVIAVWGASGLALVGDVASAAVPAEDSNVQVLNVAAVVMFLVA